MCGVQLRAPSSAQSSLADFTSQTSRLENVPYELQLQSSTNASMLKQSSVPVVVCSNQCTPQDFFVRFCNCYYQRRVFPLSLSLTCNPPQFVFISIAYARSWPYTYVQKHTRKQFFVDVYIYGHIPFQQLGTPTRTGKNIVLRSRTHVCAQACRS